jgi:hypothetical protein
MVDDERPPQASSLKSGVDGGEQCCFGTIYFPVTPTVPGGEFGWGGTFAKE